MLHYYELTKKKGAMRQDMTIYSYQLDRGHGGSEPIRLYLKRASRPFSLVQANQRSLAAASSSLCHCGGRNQPGMSPSSRVNPHG